MWRISCVRHGIFYWDDPIAETITKVWIQFHIKQDTNSNLDYFHSKTFGANPQY